MNRSRREDRLQDRMKTFLIRSKGTIAERSGGNGRRGIPWMNLRRRNDWLHYRTEIFSEEEEEDEDEDEDEDDDEAIAKVPRQYLLLLTIIYSLLMTWLLTIDYLIVNY